VRPLVYSVDLDGTLAIGSAWTCDECESLEPNQAAIDRVNELSEKHFIIIHTARRHGLYQSTVRWLEANHVRYHAVAFAKMPCDRLFDLDAINKVEDL
jgi:histidinol phosphatase-like enzyme